MSTSWANVTINPAAPSLAVSTSTNILISVLDLNGNQMAVETTEDVEAANGTIDTSSFTVGSGSVFFTVNYTAPTTSGTDNLKVTVTSPETSSETVFNFPITVTP